MKAIIQVRFKKVLGISITEEVINTTPRLMGATDKTTKELCKVIEKYFNDHKIKTNVNYILKDD